MITKPNSQVARKAYSLVTVMTFTGLSLLILGGVMLRTSTTANLTDRNNRYFKALSAAEGATEKVITRLAWDYQIMGKSADAQLHNYRLLVPTSGESAEWNNFQFSDNRGNLNRTCVERISNWRSTNLWPQFPEINATSAVFRVTSTASHSGVGSPVRATIQQDLQLAGIPIFEFGVFYTHDLEINPIQNMNFNGRIHGNEKIYLRPSGNLQFQTGITSSRQILNEKHPLDPVSRTTSGTLSYLADKKEGIDTLVFPTGTSNTPENLRFLIEVPPSSEAMSSPMGQLRYYNKADLIIVLTDTNILVRNGVYNNLAINVPLPTYATFVITTGSFYDKREAQNISAITLDVLALTAANPALKTLFGYDVKIVYIGDLRTTVRTGIRVRSGQVLPTGGLTVVTPNPLYVQGHYNAPSGILGLLYPNNIQPASLVGDSITVLSQSWSDLNSSNPLNGLPLLFPLVSLLPRRASDTTVNAAMLAGVVSTTNGFYSGGLENFPRLLEDWAAKTLTINGSFVSLYKSKIATAPFGGVDVFTSPIRNWAFDPNFLNLSKLPPGTPDLREVIRKEWTNVQTAHF